MTIVLVACTLHAGAQHLPDPSKEVSGAAWQYYANYGQLQRSDSGGADNVLYYSERGNRRLFFTDSAVSLVQYLNRDTASAAPDTALRIDMQFPCAYVAFDKMSFCPFDLSVEEPSGDSLNFYLAHCSSGITGVPGYGRVVMSNIYNSIDAHFYSSNRGPSFYFVIHPGGNPADIFVKFTGQDSIKTIAGDLYLYLNSHATTFPTTSAYEIDSAGNTAPLSWQPSWWSPDSVVAKLSVGSYNTARTLVLKIEPPAAATGGSTTGLEWCTYYGDREDDEPVAVTNGGDDNPEDIYTVMNVKPGGYPPHYGQFIGLPTQGGLEIFVSKFDKAHRRQWGTYFGGAGEDRATAAGGVRNGYVYVGGTTTSTAASLPLQDVSGFSYQQADAGGAQGALLAAFRKANGTREWMTYLNGRSAGSGFGLVRISSIVDGLDAAIYVGGSTTAAEFSTDCNNTPPAGKFPVCASTGAYNQNFNAGGTDGFLIKFDVELHKLRYSTLLGGDGDDEILGLTAQQNGSAGWHKLFAVGITTTTSIASGNSFPSGLTAHPGNGVFPLANPGAGSYFQQIHAVQSTALYYYDCFLAGFGTAKALDWCTFFGGDGDDVSRSITSNSLSSKPDYLIYITGATTTTAAAAPGRYANPNGEFPVYAGANAFLQANHGGGPYDAFFAGFTNTGQLIWSTYYGDDGDERNWKAFDQYNGGKIVCDKYGNILFSGTTQELGSPGCPTCSAPALSGGNQVYNQPQNASINETLDGQDVFAGMFRPDQHLRWATHFGGKGAFPNSSSVHDVADEALADMAFTSGSGSSKMYLKMETMSTQTPNPPCPAGAYCLEQTYGGENRDAFIACLDYTSIADPAALNASTALGTEHFSLRVAPNPAHSDIRISFIAQQEGMVTLGCTDPSGKKVSGTTISVHPGVNTYSYPLAGLAAGLYFLTLSDQQHTEYAKFLKN